MALMKRFITLSLASFLSILALSANAQETRDSSKAHLDLAVSYYQSGQFETAQNEAEKSIQIDPKNSNAFTLLGLVHMQLKENAKAEDYFKSAINANASNGDAYNNYGLLLCQTNRIDASLEQFGRALSTPRYARVPETLVNAGICLSQKQDFAAAEKFFLRALEQDPSMPAALFQLSRTYLKLNRIELAKNRLDALYRMVPPNSASTFLQMQIAKVQGDQQEVQRLSDRIVKQFPSSVEARRISVGDNTY